MASRESTTQSGKGILSPSSKMMADYSKAQKFDWQRAEGRRYGGSVQSGVSRNNPPSYRTSAEKTGGITTL